MQESDDDTRTHRHRRTESDASAGWREEYATQHVDTSLRADGAKAYTIPGEGDTIRDLDCGGEDTLIVLDTHPEACAAEFEIDDTGVTVAQLNPAYDDGAPVIEAVYLDDIEDRLEGWRSIEDIRDAVSFDVLRVYSFPADRIVETDRGDWV